MARITSKYRNKKVVVDGIRFDSKKESQRYLFLKELQDKGEISKLKLQPEFVIIPAFTLRGEKHRKSVYKADFSYLRTLDNKIIVEDVKSAFTAKDRVYRIKRKLFEYQYQEYIFKEII